MKRDLVERLRTRAEIRRNIPGRKSVEEGKPDRIAALLDEAADAIEELLHPGGPLVETNLSWLQTRVRSAEQALNELPAGRRETLLRGVEPPL